MSGPECAYRTAGGGNPALPFGAGLPSMSSHIRAKEGLARGDPMNIKEHIQFLVMMIPTLLLLVAALVTLAAPSSASQAAGADRHELAVAADAEVTPLVSVR